MGRGDYYLFSAKPRSKLIDVAVVMTGIIIFILDITLFASIEFEEYTTLYWDNFLTGRELLEHRSRVSTSN